VSVLGTNTGAVTAIVFMGTGTQLKRTFVLLLVNSPGSHHYGSSQVSVLEQAGKLAQHILMRQMTDRGSRGAGILTCFPFGTFD
jgi:hypothetical protein